MLDMASRGAASMPTPEAHDASAFLEEFDDHIEGIAGEALGGLDDIFEQVPTQQAVENPKPGQVSRSIVDRTPSPITSPITGEEKPCVPSTSFAADAASRSSGGLSATGIEGLEPSASGSLGGGSASVVSAGSANFGLSFADMSTGGKSEDAASGGAGASSRDPVADAALDQLLAMDSTAMDPQTLKIHPQQPEQPHQQQHEQQHRQRIPRRNSAGHKRSYEQQHEHHHHHAMLAPTPESATVTQPLPPRPPPRAFRRHSIHGKSSYAPSPVPFDGSSSGLAHPPPTAAAMDPQPPPGADVYPSPLPAAPFQQTVTRNELPSFTPTADLSDLRDSAMGPFSLGTAGPAAHADDGAGSTGARQGGARGKHRRFQRRSASMPMASSYVLENNFIPGSVPAPQPQQQQVPMQQIHELAEPQQLQPQQQQVTQQAMPSSEDLLRQLQLQYQQQQQQQNPPLEQLAQGSGGAGAAAPLNMIQGGSLSVATPPISNASPPIPTGNPTGAAPMAAASPVQSQPQTLSADQVAALRQQEKILMAGAATMRHQMGMMRQGGDNGPSSLQNGVISLDANGVATGSLPQCSPVAQAQTQLGCVGGPAVAAAAPPSALPVYSQGGTVGVDMTTSSVAQVLVPQGGGGIAMASATPPAPPVYAQGANADVAMCSPAANDAAAAGIGNNVLMAATPPAPPVYADENGNAIVAAANQSSFPQEADPEAAQRRRFKRRAVSMPMVSNYVLQQQQGEGGVAAGSPVLPSAAFGPGQQPQVPPMAAQQQQHQQPMQLPAGGAMQAQVPHQGQMLEAVPNVADPNRMVCPIGPDGQPLPNHTLQQGMGAGAAAAAGAGAAAADPNLLDPNVFMSKLKGIMSRSEQTMKQLQDYDKARGLPKSHSSTMVKTSRSRKQLQDGVILKKWDGTPLMTFETKADGTVVANSGPKQRKKKGTAGEDDDGSPGGEVEEKKKKKKKMQRRASC